MNSVCGTPRLLVDLPQLENLLPTTDGRLFVTGQENIYEIVDAGQGKLSGKPLFPSGGGSGITQAGDVLYFLHQDDTGGATDFSGLYALDLRNRQSTPKKIFTLVGMSLPNGLVAGPDRQLYVTDGPVATEPKIVRLQLAPDDPYTVTSQITWVLTFPEFPNGLAIKGDHLYTTLYNPGTQVGTLARIAIKPDGQPGTLEPLFRKGIMDDINVYGDTLLVTDWQNNGLLQLTLDGQLLQQTAPGTFPQPSSVDVLGPPLLPHTAALITERYSGTGLWVLESQ